MSHLQQGLSARPHNPLITMTLKEQINTERIPAHVAIIMDGNGRWAKARGQHRSMGHQEGVEAVREITTTASNLGVRFLTLYTFSTENWNRPSDEVAALMGLLRVIGEITRLPQEVLRALVGLEQRTANNSGMTMVLALSYSSRWEQTETMRRIARRVKGGDLRPEDITEDVISQELSTSFMPDPDLLIRTGGEQRLSNYLLWQSAYTELYFCDTFWPDFRSEEFYRAIVDYQGRERRFGKTSEQLTQE